MTRDVKRLLALLVVAAASLRAILAARAPTTYGYVYDFYHEAIQKFYSLGRLPASTDCWQCYHPPLLSLLGLPLYAAGKKMVGGPGGLADPALRFITVLSLASGAVAAYYSYRLLRLFRVRGRELVVGTGLVLVFPCLFISSYGIEADILLTALMTAFLYYAVTFSRRLGRTDLARAASIGGLGGLASETKYSGLLAPVILIVLTGMRLAAGPQRSRIAREAAVALIVCGLIGSWKYIDNVERYRAVFYANGSAQQGFSLSARPANTGRYDFLSLRLPDLIALAQGRVAPGHLTDIPFYGSVWTTLHAMAWGDMSMFSDPSRHGFYRQPYPRKVLNPWLASSVLVLGLVPNGLALIGFVATCYRRLLWPLAISCVITGALYVAWFLPQESWALKTKYILFLLPAYVLYALLGWRWIGHRSHAAGQTVQWLLAALIVVTHLYLLDFAWS